MKEMFNKNKSCKFIDATNEILKSYVKAPKRRRIKLSENQLFMLEYKFYENQHPSQSTKEGISAMTGLPIKNVQIWFQNRRAKEKSDKENAAPKCPINAVETTANYTTPNIYNRYFNDPIQGFASNYDMRIQDRYNGFDFDKKNDNDWMETRK